MRPGQNRRMRGRSRNKGPNPLTRSYESNGPDVKIRGTAQHVADKYAQLARDAQASGDPVVAENYFQHAEHYYRMIAAAQEQYRQQFGGLQRDEDGEEGDDEGGYNGQSPDRSQGAQGPEDFGEGGNFAPNFPQGGYDRQGQGRFDRNDRPNQNRQRFDRQGGGERYDRQGGGDRFDRQGGYDRQGGGEQRYDRQGGGERYDRQGGERQNGYDRQDRPERQERSDQGRRERFARDDRPREERGNFQPREGRPERGERQTRAVGYGGENQPEEQRESGANLPAFLTNPVRQANVDEVAESAGLTPAPAEETETTGIRPRRRRVRKADQPATEGAEAADGA